MDKIRIHELKIETVIGCLAWERKVKQSVIFDLEIEFDAQPAGMTDDLQKTLDYYQVAQSITKFVEKGQFKLIEALATQTAQLILEEFSAPHLDLHLNLTVTKLTAIPNAKAVSVNIVRP